MFGELPKCDFFLINLANANEKLKFPSPNKRQVTFSGESNNGLFIEFFFFLAGLLLASFVSSRNFTHQLRWVDEEEVISID